MTQQEVVRLLAYVDVTWPTVPDRNADAAVKVVAWHDYLADATLVEAQAAVRLCGLRGDRFPPGPAALAAEVIAGRERAAGVGAPSADAAWSEVMERVRRRGWYDKPTPASWSHPAVASVVGALGWDEVCHGDVMVVRAHFLRMFGDAVRAAQTGMLVERIGLSVGGPIRSLDAVIGDDPGTGLATM